jgi:PKD repeat protein
VDNTPPEADAGEDMSAMAGQIVIFNGTGSIDNPENPLLAFKWSFMENGIPVELTGPVAEYTFNDPGTYLITLTVQDGAGNLGIDTLELTVREPPAAPRVVGSSVIDGSTDVSVEISITIEFSESMDRISVGNSLSLSPVESYRLLWAEENTSLVIEFTDGLTDSTLYNLKLDGPLSQDGIALSPVVFLLAFTTEEKDNLSIRIDIPEGGWKVNREEVFSVSGSISGFSTGTEVTVTLGSETFSTTTGASGNFILEVMAPEELGTHEMKVRAGDLTESVNVQVVDREENGNDNLLMIIGIVLIVAVLILLAFIWVRRGGKNRYIEE